MIWLCAYKLHTSSLLFLGTTLHTPNESAEDEKQSQTGQIVLGTSHGHRTLPLSLAQLDPSQRRVQKTTSAVAECLGMGPWERGGWTNVDEQGHLSWS